ncbi:MAG TPA: sensor histidine kinase [Candidatus Sulfotelmatobacter sp.]|nr:sensor histidine kinase [Candidatus Sulfotelmatobacter sp.]
MQPFADHPFTKIETDSTWSNTTHPGTEYAALLVGPDFRPPSTADVLPTEGVIASAVVRGEIGFWQKWWFPLVCLIAGALVVLGFHRLRLHQISNKLNLRFEERLAERMRIAQELHDTLLQGVLSASMQLHVAVEKLPEDSAARPNLNRSLQLMTQVIEEGRNTLRGLRASTESARDLEAAFSGIPHEFGNHRDIDFRVIVQGQTVPLRAGIRDEIYCIGREALMNALRHSRASHIEVQLEYGVKQLRIIVSDDGCGIDPLFLQTGRDGHWGLSGMRERAKSIGARLRVLSRPDAGTEVELSVPGNIAFVSNPPGGVSKWTARLLPKSKRAVGEFPGEHNQ